MAELEEQHTSTEQGVESDWKTIKETVVNTAHEDIGYRRGNKKEKWITDNTWRAIDERRELKAKKEQAFRTAIQIQEINNAYRNKDKEEKSRCKADKQSWVEEKLAEAESAAGKGDSKTLYRIVKDLSGKEAQNVPINHQ